jgi:hypothetical protein
VFWSVRKSVVSQNLFHLGFQWSVDRSVGWVFPVKGFDGCLAFFPVEAHVGFDLVVLFDDGVYVMVELKPFLV